MSSSDEKQCHWWKDNTTAHMLSIVYIALESEQFRGEALDASTLRKRSGLENNIEIIK